MSARRPARKRNPPTPAPGAGTGTVVVNHTAVKDASLSNRLGINADYWWDAQGNRAGGARTLAAALGDLSVRWLRYPGGEKADGTLFFQAGDSLTPNPRLVRISANDWPSNDPTYWTPASSTAGTWAHPIYNFDTFMADCAAVGGTPMVVVGLDGIYKAAEAGGTKMSKAQAVYNAQEFVRYANITNSYGVKHWEIGNEPWLDGYIGGQTNPSLYAADFADVAAAMKAVDPTIQVGASVNTQAYAEGVLATAAASVDFLTVHPYPTFGLTYAQYQAATLNALTEVNAAVAALANYPAHQHRIWVAVTETGHLNAINNMGTAVIAAHIFGQLLDTPAVRLVEYWNTRWINNNNPVASRDSNDAFDNLNQLTPTGRVLAMFGASQLGATVTATSSNANVFPFAYRDQVSGRVDVILVNRASSSQAVTVAVAGRTTGTRYQLAGTGDTDTAPTHSIVGTVTLSSGVTPSLTLPAVSVTRLDFTG